MENFGEYLLGALGCINMILAMRKFEIQWTFVIMWHLCWRRLAKQSWENVVPS